MHLKDKGYRFCVSPDKTVSRWVPPAESRHHADWHDMTDASDEELLALLAPATETPPDKS
ncbi:hypothetical protein [Pseudomonas paeninsulae]|uniref:hypothetical protein n=1 Tax=Pseudomonas paeninsulae TaxID=3110772 RepID=UPI002D777599|nr:hypothetical protein [Pseudomonas sp. IT1137]